MREARRTGVVGLLVALTFAGAGSAHAGDTPLDLLKGRGLTKAGKVFVVDSEAGVLKRWGEVRPQYLELVDQYQALVAIQQEKARLLDLDDELIGRRQRLQEIDAELGSLPAGNNSAIKMARQQLKEERANVDRRRAALRAEIDRCIKRVPNEPQFKQLCRAFEQRRRQFVDGASDLGPMVNHTLKEYADLDRDPTVKNALKTLRQSTKSSISLGPSPEFKLVQKQMKEAQRTIQPDVPTKKGTKKKRK